MKRRSFLQTLTAVPAALVALKVSAQAPTLKAAPFVLPENPKLPDAGFNRGNIKVQDCIVAADDLAEQLRVVYNSHFLDPIDDITRKSVIYDMSQVCLNFGNRRKLYEFLVICDDSNNTQTDINNRNLNVDVFVRHVGTPYPIKYHFDICGMTAEAVVPQ